MKLNNIKRISKEDMARKEKNIPDWVDPMLETLNAFIEQVTTAINGNLTFSDNMLGKEVVLEFTSATEQIISAELDGRAQLRPYAVVLADTNGAEVNAFNWRVLSSGKVGVTITFLSATSGKCRILIYLR